MASVASVSAERRARLPQRLRSRAADEWRRLRTLVCPARTWSAYASRRSASLRKAKFLSLGRGEQKLGRCCAARTLLHPPPARSVGEGTSERTTMRAPMENTLTSSLPGFDPAIHAAEPRMQSEALLRRTSAWTTGSSPVVTRSVGMGASLRAQRSNPGGLRGKLDCFVATAPRNDGVPRPSRES
jgi:hypothetical protein